jgi:predicted anti-sigma-YlaC factor YlaD
VDSVDRVPIETHLAQCEPCREELAAVSDARSFLRDLAVVDPPVGALDIPAEVISISGRRPRRLVAAAAAAVVVVGIGFGVGANRSVPLPLNQVVEQHVARASVDPGFNVIQVQAVVVR